MCLITHSLFISSPWTLFILSFFLDTIFFFLGDCSIYSLPLIPWVSTPPSQLGWFLQDAPAWVCQHIKSAVPMSLHPRFNLRSRSRLLPMFPCRSAHTSCPVGVKSVMHTLYLITHFKLSISVSRKSILDFISILYDTKIKPNQLALYHLHITNLSSQSKHHVHNW